DPHASRPGWRGGPRGGGGGARARDPVGEAAGGVAALPAPGGEGRAAELAIERHALEAGRGPDRDRALPPRDRRRAVPWARRRASRAERGAAARPAPRAA